MTENVLEHLKVILLLIGYMILFSQSKVVLLSNRQNIGENDRAFLRTIGEKVPMYRYNLIAMYD